MHLYKQVLKKKLNHKTKELSKIITRFCVKVLHIKQLKILQVHKQHKTCDL